MVGIWDDDGKGWTVVEDGVGGARAGRRSRVARGVSVWWWTWGRDGSRDRGG